MRMVHATDYTEPRDAIAQDWFVFFQKAFPQHHLILLPNIGLEIKAYAERSNLDSIILSGGENLGTDSIRDLTECTLFSYAQERNIPLLGICRGAQHIYTLLGGKTEQSISAFANLHLATRHVVQLNNALYEVNSYHSLKLKEPCPTSITVLGRCTEDNSIEAYCTNNILALMWHPEREASPSSLDIQLISQYLNL